MYFSILPNIKYDVKPQSFPFSSSDYVEVNNFFRRYLINEDIFDYLNGKISEKQIKEILDQGIEKFKEQRQPFLLYN